MLKVTRTTTRQSGRRSTRVGSLLQFTPRGISTMTLKVLSLWSRSLVHIPGPVSRDRESGCPTKKKRRSQPRLGQGKQLMVYPW